MRAEAPEHNLVGRWAGCVAGRVFFRQAGELLLTERTGGIGMFGMWSIVAVVLFVLVLVAYFAGVRRERAGVARC